MSQLYLPHYGEQGVRPWMAEALYLTDAYLREFDTRVRGVDGESLQLEETAFYPAGGGQPSDSGSIMDGSGNRWMVVGVEKQGAAIRHAVEGSGALAPGTAVHGSLDWPRRYTHMRYHTALHILSGVVFRRFGSGITGGQIYDDRARMDFSLSDFGRPLAEELIGEMNAVVGQALPIEVRFLTREEARRDPSLVRVAAELMPEVEQVRLIDIRGFDVQADGGTHVRSTREVGEVRLERIENKGARNKRLYLTVAPGSEDL